MSENKTVENGETSYDGALDALLNSDLHQAKSKEALAKTAARRTKTVQDMKTYLRRLSILSSSSKSETTTTTTKSSIVHITGTKGKGSTASMCESILREHYGYRTGLFTSPHLVDIRERIRINGQPVSKAVFAQVYWEIRQRLEGYNYTNTINNDNATEDGDSEDDDPDLPVLPGYFRMLTLMALFTFSHYEPPLDVIILEVGMGGRYDATNVLDMDNNNNVVCGVTLLDLDHTRVLGDTLEQIAWEKGGIFQAIKGSNISSNIMNYYDNNNSQEEGDDGTQQQQHSEPTLFVIDSNTQSVLSVFEKCAKEESKGRKLKIVGNCTKVVPSNVTIGLPGDHQRINAELAVALCEAVTKSMTASHQQTNNNNNAESLYQALAHASWPGRCQTVPFKDAALPTNLRLDGSHTPISLQAGYDWFCSVSHSTTADTAVAKRRILIFNCSHERNPLELLQLLLPTTTTTDDASNSKPAFFEKAYFCRADFSRPSAVTKANAKDLLQDQGIEVRADLLPNDDESSTTTVVTWQMTLESIWKHLEVESKAVEKAETVVNLTVGEALDQIKVISDDGNNNKASSELEVFVAGSLYIVGSALNAIGWSEPEAEGSLNLK